MKNALSVDPIHSLNIYITSTYGDKGWATYPWDYYANQNPLLHGVVIRTNVLPNGSDPDNNMGIVTTHEVGHYLGLYHTFDDFDVCKDADLVSDTPIHKANSGCPSPNPDTCPQQPGLDPIHNYMNYTNDLCRIEFTYGQGVRMNQIVQEFKPNLGGSILYINTTRTINNGNSWKFQNVTLNFQPGNQIIVNGNFAASNVTFISSSTWGGIQFNSGSNGTLDNCNITNASTGVYMYNCSPTIRDCTIQNNGTGIYCDYYSSPNLYGNTIKNNTAYGVRCNMYSSPNFLYFGYPGSNVIRNNGANGIYAYYYSNPYLGSSSYGGNSIYGNIAPQVAAIYYCTIPAQMNWWGTSNPDYSLFDVYYSTIIYLPALSSDPNPGRAVIANLNKNLSPNLSVLSIEGDDLDLALEKQNAKDYDGAIALYLSVVKKERTSSKGKYALVKIDECFTQGNKKDFLTFSAQQLKPIVKDDRILSELLLELDTHWLINSRDYNKAINNLSTIQKDYNLDKEIDKATLFRIGAVYAIHLNDKQKAEKIFDEFMNKYPNDPLAGDIDRLLSMNANKNVVGNNGININSSQAKEIVSEENFLSNYPNPFNPTTKITFSIPQRSQIKLKVFDVLGREVSLLVDGIYEAGNHEVTFDASSANGGLPSGVYFYNLTTASGSISKKMLLIK